MRRWHVLKSNLRSETAHNVVFFDTETHARKQKDGSERDYLTFGWLCAMSRKSDGDWGREHWHRYTKVKQFWDHLDNIVRPKSRWFVFCHNTNFDLPVIDIFGHPPKRGWVLEVAVIEGPPTIITYKRDGATLTFLDTLNWWRMPLAALGDRVGIPKMAMPGATSSRKVWDAYCRRDIDVIRKTVLAWFDFLKRHDLGGFASTLAGQAFRSYRHKFMPHPIVIDADEPSALLARESYHGGRVECFDFGHVPGPIYGYDVNSMFPAVMRGNVYPTKLLGIYPEQAASRWERILRDYAVVARCRVRTESPCYPLMTKGGLSFPRGEFETVMATPEISLAMERGELLSMRDLVIYEKAEIFSDFVDFMYRERLRLAKAGDPVGSWLFKILMNSLYGKFGQTGQVYEAQEQIEDRKTARYSIVDADTGKIYRCRQMAGLLQVLSSQGEARESFPAIASHVTSYARVLLWSLIERAGVDRVVYCDTDSLYVRGNAARRLKAYIHPTRLGGLKQIGRWDWITLHGLKDYELPGNVVRKGIRKDAVELSPGVFRQVQWASLKGLVGRGDASAPGRRSIIKTLKREYKKPRRV